MRLFLSPILITILLVFSGHLPTAISQNGSYPHCDRTFTCGSLQNISYPFTGGDRPAHCGLPELRLRCRDNFAELTSDSVDYRVLQIDRSSRTLRLARLDLWNSTCPPTFVNSTFGSSIFVLNSGNTDLTVFYGCSLPMDFNLLNRFSCNVNGVDSSDAFYLIGPLPIDSNSILPVVSCSIAIRVPALIDAANRLAINLAVLPQVLMEGFNLNYRNPYENHCSRCIQAGAQCGFDSELDESICICGDRRCDETVPAPSPGGNRGPSRVVPLAVGISVGSVALIGLGLACFGFSYRQKKRRLAAEAAEAIEAKSKDLPSPFTSIGLTTPPSTNYSQSIPSYPSSKSDLEKGSTYFGVQVFSYIELEEATDNFDPAKELGDGGFGTVYYGKLRDGRIVAVKRLYENNFKRVEQFMNEVEILTRLRHPNLVTLFGCTSRRSRELLLVYEYIPNGTVADHLHGKRASSGLLSWPVRLNIAIETADALAYLHTSEIIHRDVKTNNILLDNDFRVKVADFGLSRLFPTDVTHVSTAPQGTPGYVDPEYYQCYQLTSKSDVYSFGVVLIELISSKQAVDTNRHRHDINLSNMAVNKIQNHALHELVDESLGFDKNSSVRTMITQVAELAFRCLQPERDMRPTMEELLVGLKRIKNEDYDAEGAEVLDITEDEVGLLKNHSPPMSPNSSTPNSSA